MKHVFTHQNRLVVYHARSLVENAGIATSLRNEYASGAAGELAPTETWLELWVVDDADGARALSLIEGLANTSRAPDWQCPACQETSPANFETCWHCACARPA